VKDEEKRVIAAARVYVTRLRYAIEALGSHVAGDSLELVESVDALEKSYEIDGD
jgi:hypothetical protein